MLFFPSKSYKVIRVKTAIEMRLHLTGGWLILCVSRKHTADVGSHQAGVFPTHQTQSIKIRNMKRGCSLTIAVFLGGAVHDLPTSKPNGKVRPRHPGFVPAVVVP